MTTLPKSRPIGRLILAFGALALAGSTALLTWWSTTLRGLPDVGDPFDVEAFQRTIPDDTNAFVLYRKAAAILTKEPDSPANYDWKTADTAQRAWFERSGEALKLWREGTDRPDSLYHDARTITFETKFDVAQALRSFGRLALLQGSQLEDSGDFEGALGWYLALLRASRHCGKHGTLIERLIGIAMHRWASTRLIRWAAEPGVNARMLRLALDASLAIDRATPPTSDALKMEYLIFTHAQSNPELMVELYETATAGPSSSGQSGPVLASEGLRKSFLRLRRRAIHEPERSRRVIRMVFANWLAYCDLPLDQRPSRVAPGPNTALNGTARSLLVDLYDVRDDAPAQVRALPPEKLAQWFGTTIDAWMALPAFVAFDKALARERSAQDSLLFTLANELHKREHGQYPQKPEELVGPYLKALPPGYATPK